MNCQRVSEAIAIAIGAGKPGRVFRVCRENGPTERQRTAIVLSHFEECSQSEAASIMGITESALEALLVRGRTALRQHLHLEQH